MQRFRARKMLEPPKGGFDMDPLILMETNICDEEPWLRYVCSFWIDTVLIGGFGLGLI